MYLITCEYIQCISAGDIDALISISLTVKDSKYVIQSVALINGVFGFLFSCVGLKLFLRNDFIRYKIKPVFGVYIIFNLKKCFHLMAISDKFYAMFPINNDLQIPILPSHRGFSNIWANYFNSSLFPLAY